MVHGSDPPVFDKRLLRRDGTRHIAGLDQSEHLDEGPRHGDAIARDDVEPSAQALAVFSTVAHQNGCAWCGGGVGLCLLDSDGRGLDASNLSKFGVQLTESGRRDRLLRVYREGVQEDWRRDRSGAQPLQHGTEELLAATGTGLGVEGLVVVGRQK